MNNSLYQLAESLVCRARDLHAHLNRYRQEFQLHPRERGETAFRSPYAIFYQAAFRENSLEFERTVSRRLTTNGEPHLRQWEEAELIEKWIKERYPSVAYADGKTFDIELDQLTDVMFARVSWYEDLCLSMATAAVGLIGVERKEEEGRILNRKESDWQHVP